MNYQSIVAVFVLSGSMVGAEHAVSFKHGTGRVDVEMDGEPLTTFYHGAEWDKPFLHPLRTLSGIVVTRGFPVEKIEGETTDHLWHRGLWYGYEDINEVDFWRELGEDKTGRIVSLSSPTTTTNRHSGTLSADLVLVTPKRKVLGTLREEFTFRASGNNVFIDARVTLSADHGVSLKIGDAEDGGFAVRLADEFGQDRGATLLNSDGLVGTENIWGKRARWVDYSAKQNGQTVADEFGQDRGATLLNSDGLVGTENIWGKRARWVDYSAKQNGQTVGVAMFDHPANPKHPTYWHARGRGSCVANPFGDRAFLGDESVDGSMTIAEGSQLQLRYRVVIHAGDAREADLERLYTDYVEGR